MQEYQFDENVSMKVAVQLRSYGYTIMTYLETGLRHVTDDEHFLAAVQHQLPLVTNNRKDFILLHNAWRRWTAAWGLALPHPGVLVLEQEANPAQATQAILDFDQTGWPLQNELYQWRRSTGWLRYPSN